jgi:hypothetical protein
MFCCRDRGPAVIEAAYDVQQSASGVRQDDDQIGMPVQYPSEN